MCGFVGMINFSGLPGSTSQRHQVLDGMLSRVAHRGPDEESFHDDGILALGFRRLSIIDVKGGQQPFWNENKQILGVVNGEIYNHQELRAQLETSHSFGSHSDSEVLLHLYEDHGIDMLDKVNGMFASVIWDTQNRRLVLARDRLGIKPLYYTVVGDTLLFASELKALLAHPDCPRELDWQAVKQGKAVHRPITPSYVVGVYHLPAGHMLVFEPGKQARPFPYWSLQDHFAGSQEKPLHSLEYYIERYGELFEDSVKKRLMSEVPLGIFLSGGIDSTLIAAVAASQKTGLHCFTIAEKTTDMTGDLKQARIVANELGFPLHPVLFNAKTLLDDLNFDLEYLEYLIWCADSPRFNFEWFFKHELHRYAKTNFPDLKVILTGSGADEFAGGYSTSFTRPRNNWQEYLRKHVEPFWVHFKQLEDEQRGQLPSGSNLDQERLHRCVYQHMMYMNLASLQFYNLWHEDRTSSSQGIEARVPFLDHRLIELLASVPPVYYEELFWNKRIVRDQLSRLLPNYTVDFPKVPFLDVPCNDSIQVLKVQILKRTFGEFKKKYAKSAATILPGVQLDRFYSVAVSESHEAKRAIQMLLQIMQIEIFRQICLQGWRTPPSISASSPLKEDAS